jgi:hypothetical protein
MTNDTILPLQESSCYTDSVKSSLNRPLLGQKETSESCEPPQNPLARVFSCHSFAFATGVATVGFVFQLVTLCVYTYALLRSGNHNDEAQLRSCFLCIRLLSLIDVLLYAVVWVNFNLMTTQSGFHFLQQRFERYNSAASTRKSVFNAGIFGLISIVLGSFLAWTVFDLLLGSSPVPFVQILFTRIVNFLFYAMIGKIMIREIRKAEVVQQQFQK